MASADLARVLDPGFLEGLASRSIDELRRMREAGQRVEGQLSYARRLAQGRLDIVRAELARRAAGVRRAGKPSGGQPAPEGTARPGGGLEDLVAELPAILADGPRAAGPGRPPANLLPPEDGGEAAAELEAVLGAGTMGSLPELAEARLAELGERLAELEARLSAERRQVFGVIDAIQAEVVRRYAGGAVDAATALG